MSTINFYYPLITATQLKSLITTINNNISDEFILTLIEIEQKKVIRPILGYSFYNEIQLQVSGDTLTSDNEIIYDDYLKLILAYSVYKRLIVDMTYQLENAGLRKKYSDVSESADPSELSYVRKMIQEDLDFYKTELVKYVQQNVSKYPLYFNDTDSRWNTRDKQRNRGYNFGMNISDDIYNNSGFDWNIRKI